MELFTDLNSYHIEHTLCGLFFSFNIFIKIYFYIVNTFQFLNILDSENYGPEKGYH